MRERGFSLVEMMLILIIMGILICIASLTFSEYIRRNDKEIQTRTIHSELMQARLHALTERRGRRVKVTRTAFEVYSSSKDDVAPQLKLSLKYPVIWNGGGTNIEIDERGMVSSGTLGSVCLEDVSDRNLLDSVVVAVTWVSLGSRQEGEPCATNSITVK